MRLFLASLKLKSVQLVHWLSWLNTHRKKWSSWWVLRSQLNVLSHPIRSVSHADPPGVQVVMLKSSAWTGRLHTHLREKICITKWGFEISWCLPRKEGLIKYASSCIMRNVASSVFGIWLPQPFSKWHTKSLALCLKDVLLYLGCNLFSGASLRSRYNEVTSKGVIPFDKTQKKFFHSFCAWPENIWYLESVEPVLPYLSVKCHPHSTSDCVSSPRFKNVPKLC